MTPKPIIALGLVSAGLLIALGVTGAVVAAGSLTSRSTSDVSQTTADPSASGDAALDMLTDGGPETTTDDFASASPTPHPHTTAADPATGDVITPDGQPPKSHHPPAKPTAEERACMADLTAQVKEATLRLTDPEVARAEGYRFPDDPTKTHMGNRAYVKDGMTLDYAHPETAIYKMQADGTYQLVGVMFLALKGQGPQPCGNATWWHTHTHCVDDATNKRLDMPGDQPCPPGSTTHEGRAEMMHVWFVPRKQR